MKTKTASPVAGAPLHLIYGSAMEPTIRHGDIVSVAPKKSADLNGKVVAFAAQNSQVVARRLFVRPDQKIELRADNPQTTTIVLNPRAEKFTVLGVIENIFRSI